MKKTFVKFTNHIKEGEYTGYIVDQYSSEQSSNVWLKIEVDKVNVILNVSISEYSPVFNRFVEAFVVDGEYDTDDFKGTLVEFSVADKVINGEKYSKIKSIKAVEEDEEI